MAKVRNRTAFPQKHARSFSPTALFDSNKSALLFSLSMPPLTRLTLPGEERDKTLLAEAESYIYATSSDGHELQGHFFSPEEKPTEPVPFVAFFHGGMWDNGRATQFAPQCLNFAARGLKTGTFDYRTISRHDGSPSRAIDDVQTALLGLKQNAADLGIDPERIIAVGAAAGACAVLNAAMMPDKKILTDNDGLNARPAAAVGLSALTNTTAKGLTDELFATAAEAKELSPSSMVRRGLPATLFLHGRHDRTIPVDHVERFVKSLKRKRNKTELIVFEGGDHSFFNFNVSEALFDHSLRSIDAFLCSLGFLEPEEITEY